jgi:endonuclease/exonuclease/phosphatase family metal-dependent hydrolase
MAGSISIVTYNIQHGRGMDGHYDLKRTACTLKELDPDIVLLQEVDCRRPATHMACQPAVLAKWLDMDYAYGAVKRYSPGSYGNAILSRYPIINKKNHFLNSEDDQRCCLEVKIAAPQFDLTVFNLHLGLKPTERYDNVKEIILPQVQAVCGPALLGGDFNAQPESAEIKLLTDCLQDSFQVNSGENIYTFPSDQPRRRIDYIFFNDCWSLNDYKITTHTLASDHLPVMVKAAC